MNAKAEKDKLSQFCAPGTKIKEEMVPVSENVSLRVITFTPKEKNDNPVVLFVAGWISHISSWELALLEMTKDFTVYYVETREKISAQVRKKEGFGVEDIGRDIVALIKRFKFEDRRYIIFASSLGATGSLDGSRFFENPPLCFALVGPNAVFRVPKIWKVVVSVLPPQFYVVLKPLIKWYLKTFRLDVKNDYAQYEKYCKTLDAAVPWKLRKGIIAVWNYEIWDLLKDIKTPTLIVGASKDKLHEPGNLEKMVSMMPNAAHLDMETNAKAHSEEMVIALRKYLKGLKKGE
jgi:pimeloyl-ACP methyl ester carboxylesterase